MRVEFVGSPTAPRDFFSGYPVFPSHQVEQLTGGQALFSFGNCMPHYETLISRVYFKARELM